MLSFSEMQVFTVTAERIGDLVPTGRLGLIGMHERARLLGGTLQIESEADMGTTVIVDVPV